MDDAALEQAARRSVEMVRSEGGVLVEDFSDDRVRQLLIDHHKGLHEAYHRHWLGFRVPRARGEGFAWVLNDNPLGEPA